VFISFEGIEGSGKSTQVHKLAQLFSRRQIPHVVTREPGGTRLGQLVRRILLDSQHREMESLTELLLYAADRAQHVAQVIRPALAAGKWIICDRFADATIAYQGFGRGQNMDLIHELNRMATQGVWPELTLLLDCPVEVGLHRARQRIDRLAPADRQDRFEQQSQSFHQKVRNGYLQLAAAEPERFMVLDATKDPDLLHEEIVALLAPHVS